MDCHSRLPRSSLPLLPRYRQAVLRLALRQPHPTPLRWPRRRFQKKHAFLLFSSISWFNFLFGRQSGGRWRHRVRWLGNRVDRRWRKRIQWRRWNGVGRLGHWVRWWRGQGIGGRPRQRFAWTKSVGEGRPVCVKTVGQPRHVRPKTVGPWRSHDWSTVRSVRDDSRHKSCQDCRSDFHAFLRARHMPSVSLPAWMIRPASPDALSFNAFRAFPF